MTMNTTLTSMAGLLPDPAAEWRYRKALCRDAYDRGWAAAWEAGRRALLEELAAGQQRGMRTLSGVLESPEHARLEQRRYGPGGRGEFGDWRPGDYQGGDVTW